MGRQEHMGRNGHGQPQPQRRPQAPRSAIRAYEEAESDAYREDNRAVRRNAQRYSREPDGYRQERRRKASYDRINSNYVDSDTNTRSNRYMPKNGVSSTQNGYDLDTPDYGYDTPVAAVRNDGRNVERKDIAEGVQPVDLEVSGDIERAKKERRQRAKDIKRGTVGDVPGHRQLTKRIQKSFREAGMFGRKANGNEVLSSVVISDLDRPLVTKKNRWYNFRTNLVMFISLSVAIVCMGIIVYQYTTSMQESNDLSNIADTYTEVAAPTAKDTSQLPPIVDFDGLKAINNEISGWLYIPGTVINYPVLTSTDQTKYLRKDYKGNHSTNGSIFTDYENDNDLNTDQHIVLYGHHLPWTAMFTEVQKYVEPDFFNSHKLAYFETPETTYVLAPVGSYNVKPDEYETRQVKFGSADDFQKYLDKRLSRCDKVKDEDTAKNRRTMDKLFTMITCDNHGKARAVVEWTVTASYPTKYVKNVIENSD